MRTIKFRVWDKSQKTYDSYNPYSRTNDFFIKQDGVLFSSFGDSIASEDDGEFVIEQFTGLYDKNGKEIYEGDIVTVSPEFEPSAEDIHTGEVIFAIGYGAYMIDFHNYDLNDVLLVPTIVDKRVIVIGNVHENKDLM